MKPTAVFLDRDGTIIKDCGYIGDPDEVRLLPGAADAIRRFSRLGHLVVLVSNQSGVARGFFDEEALERVHTRLEEVLAEQGASLDGSYYCPYLAGSEATVDAFRRESELRKPEPGMLLQAAHELHIDLSQSWMVGDSASDMEAGRRAGCRTILIEPNGLAAGEGGTAATHRVSTLREAVEIVTEGVNLDHESRMDSGPSRDEKRSVQILGQIRDQLERAHRQERQQDFSGLRLFGALLQMFAIVVALWGAAALFGEEATTATARFTLACFLQIASVSAFAIDRFR